MKRVSPFAVLLVASFALGSGPALAQYANEFSLAKVVKQGTTTQPIAGSGSVKIQVLVNADGTHKVIKVISSTNPGDNAAALELAQNAKYSPAHRGTRPVTSFYDYILKFNGTSVAPEDANDPISAAVDALIRGGHYADAIAKANGGLAANPSDARLSQLLGVAQYYDGDKVAAAQTFEKTPSIDKQFSSVAASAYAEAALKVASTDPAQSLEFAEKGVSTAGSGQNNQFALGVAQVVNDKFSDAIASLKPLPGTSKDPKVKLGIDGWLLSAYLGNNDEADATALAAEMKQLDPSNTTAARAIANHYVSAGNAAMSAKDYAGALKAFDQAANAGDPQEAVTANTGAAFALMQMSKPDYTKALSYAQKALVAAPNDPIANYYVGVAYQGIYLTASHSDKDKQQALTYLKKADEAAKAAGNTTLATQIESQIKAIASSSPQ